MILHLLTTLALAKDLPGEEIFVAPPTAAPVIEAAAAQPSVSTTAPKPKKSTKGKSVHPTNIPREYLVRSNRQSTQSELIQPPKGSAEIFRGIRVGGILEVSVNHSVIAFPDEKSPVIGVSGSGSLSGYRFMGESYLEPNSKRIFVNFSRVVIGQQIYDLKGVGVSAAGQPGLIGEYHSREAEYFTGDFIASFAAGYFDGLVPRRTNAFGHFESDSTVDNAVKKGLASGALSTADRFREKLKKVPEFSEIKGPFNLKILILDQAKSYQ